MLPQHTIWGDSTSALAVLARAQVPDPLHEPGVTHLLIPHNIGVFEYVADRLMVMKAGRVDELEPCAETLARPSRDCTRQLLAAVPRLVTA